MMKYYMLLFILQFFCHLSLNFNGEKHSRIFYRTTYKFLHKKLQTFRFCLCLLKVSDDSNSETLTLHHSKSETFIQTCKDVANLCRCNRCSAAAVANLRRCNRCSAAAAIGVDREKSSNSSSQEWYFSLFGQKNCNKLKYLGFNNTKNLITSYNANMPKVRDYMTKNSYFYQKIFIMVGIDFCWSKI